MKQCSKTENPYRSNERLVFQGELYWAALAEPQGTEPGIPHPHVIVQEDGSQTVVICALTTNRKRASLPGNVLLEAGEANLPRQSVVEVSKLSRVDRAQLGEFIGALSQPRIDQILVGIRFVERLREPVQKVGER